MEPIIYFIIFQFSIVTIAFFYYDFIMKDKMDDVQKKINFYKKIKVKK